MTGRTQKRPARRAPALSGPSPRSGAKASGSAPARTLPRLAAPTVRNEPMLNRCTRSAGRLCSTMNGGQHEERHRIVGEDQARRTEDVAAVGNQKDAAPPEEVREDPRGDDGETVGNPIDGGQLRDEERVVSCGEQVEIEQEPPDAHREAAERSAQQQESRVPAETAHASEIVAAAARLPEEEKAHEDRERDAKEPDDAGDLR